MAQLFCTYINTCIIKFSQWKCLFFIIGLTCRKKKECLPRKEWSAFLRHEWFIQRMHETLIFRMRSLFQELVHHRLTFWSNSFPRRALKFNAFCVSRGAVFQKAVSLKMRVLLLLCIHTFRFAPTSSLTCTHYRIKYGSLYEKREVICMLKLQRRRPDIRGRVGSLWRAGLPSPVAFSGSRQFAFYCGNRGKLLKFIQTTHERESELKSLECTFLYVLRH